MGCNYASEALISAERIFALPSALSMFSNTSCGAGRNEELGRNNARLPVVHVKTKRENYPFGVWFYYARGCSNMTWDTGRTMKARNKCEAPVRQSRAAGERDCSHSRG